MTLLQGRADRWSTWREILRVNPLARHHREMADKIREERDNALEDTRLAATFKSFRGNLPSGDEASVLVPVADWEATLARPVAGPFGAPICALDLGGGRAWSAAVAVWRSGRVEALALAPGVPSLEAQERRDRQPFGVYRRLLKDGRLRVSEGVRVPPVADLVRAVGAAWGRPEICFVDRFRLPELMDAAPGWQIIPRVSRWSESTFDIGALRRYCADGPLTIETKSRALLTASLAVAATKADDAGNVRLQKRGTHNQARDDVAAALVLACGALARAPKPHRLRSADRRLSRGHHALSGKGWQLARLRCFGLAGWRCNRCGRPGRLEAHHRVRLADGGAPFDLANLESLCRGCHIAEHRDDGVPEDRRAWRRLVSELV